MAKKTPRTKAIETLQKLVRLKHADDNGYCTCVTCGKVDHWKSMDGGHFIPKGNSSYWALVEENIHPQCKGCNGFGMRYGTAAQQYTLYMVDTYGRDFVDEMEAKKGNMVKYYKKDYEEMTKIWNEQIREHLSRIGE
jgi:hypothetical protein